jgi:hypothetical protein
MENLDMLTTFSKRSTSAVEQSAQAVRELASMAELVTGTTESA